MEQIANMVNGSRGLLVLGFLAVGLIVAVVLIKTGYLTLNKGGVVLSSRQNELALIRDQLEYVDNVLDGSIRDLPKELQNDHTLIAIGKVKDVMERTIIFNHIRDTESYIQLKQDTVYNTVLKWTTNDYFISAEFRKYINDLVERLVRKLYKMREEGK